MIDTYGNVVATLKVENDRLRAEVARLGEERDETATLLGQSELRYRLDVGSDVNDLKCRLQAIASQLDALRTVVREQCDALEGLVLHWESLPGKRLVVASITDSLRAAILGGEK